MLLNAHNRRAIFQLYLLLCIGGLTALARAGNYFPYNRSTGKVAQVGYRPASVGYHQPSARNHTQWQGNNQMPHTQYNQQPMQNRGVFNQTRPHVANQAQYPAFGQQGNFNNTRPSWQQQPAQYPAHGQHASPNQTRSAAASYPYQSQGIFNPPHQQPFVPKATNYTQYPSNGQQQPMNYTRPVWQQASAPQLPNYPVQPAVPSTSWASSTNQTNLYPKLPTVNSPQSPTGNVNNGSPQQLAHNWQSGGQAALSYPLPAVSANKNPYNYQGNSNPYAKIFN